ncbi:1719_t:CDS:1 [Paraglomus brasilianum]|uniref:1719_t:CDS:1 n=1 Tax=Paraglomus brasilianum TaxID=144538 RepID=A0A9N9CXX0_9GLOM|nr:1719_t:CDS:1 [Paraglomus brasilianum]
MSSSADNYSARNDFREKVTISGLSKAAQYQKRHQIDSLVHIQSNRLNLPFQHIQLLSLIILGFSDSANAFKGNTSSANEIIETVFDLLITVLIPVILVAKNNKTDTSIFSRAWLTFLAIILNYAQLSLKIWFWVRAYETTHDFFFITYLIANITTSQILCCFIRIHPRIVVTIISSSTFVIDLVFLFLAAKKGYVDSSTYLFIVIPIIIAFALAIVIFVKIIRENPEDDHKDDDIFSLYMLDFGKFNRPIWIIGFCSSLVNCSIVGPSILWIKVYITLGIISYTAVDTRDELRDKESEFS